LIRAKLEEELVDSAMSELFGLTRAAPERRHIVEIFPIITKKPKQPEPSPMDLIELWPEYFMERTSNIPEQARLDLTNALVVYDRLSAAGLSPNDFYTPVIIEEGNIIAMPTLIDGVYLRSRSLPKETGRVLEFVMEPVIG